MSADPIRERDLEQVGVRAAVSTDNGVCTIRLPAAEFDRLCDVWEEAAKKAEAPEWFDEVLDRLTDIESDLTSAIEGIRWDLRDLKKKANDKKAKAS